MNLENLTGIRSAWKGTLLVREYNSEDDFKHERYSDQGRIDGVLIEDIEELPRWMRRDAESKGYIQTNPELKPSLACEAWYVALDFRQRVIEYQAHVGQSNEGKFLPKYDTTDGL